MRSPGGLSETAISLDGYPLMILDHIVAQDVRGHEILDIPQNPILDLDLRRDSAPAARRPCKDVVTTSSPGQPLA